MNDSILSLIKHNNDISGAPFNIGDSVLILNNPNNDLTFDEFFIYKKGVVKYFEYNCGCGQSFPNDPLIGVLFPDKRVEEFWKEEIRSLQK